MAAWHRLTRRSPAGDDLAGRLRWLSGLGIVVVALLSLAIRGLGGFNPPAPPADQITMAPITATCLFLLALALLATPSNVRTDWRQALAVVCAALVAVLDSVGLFGWWTGTGSLLDPESVASDPPWGWLASPAMVPAVAVPLWLGSIGLLLGQSRHWPWRRDLGELAGLLVAVFGGVFVLGNLYAALPLYHGSRIPIARGTGLCLVLLGLGLIAVAGPESLLLRPLIGRSVKARLLRAFLPYAAIIVIVSDSLTLVAARLLSPSSSALTSASSVALATALAVGLCVFLASHIGRRLERAETDLREANEHLESRVQERTRELENATRQLEFQNQRLQQYGDELARTAESERKVHQDLKAALEDLQRAEVHLIQSEKLASIGQVVAGVAHEVNNPLAFVSNNMAMLDRDIIQLSELIRLYKQHDHVLEQHDREGLAEIRALAERIDVDYLLSSLPSLLDRSRGGLMRIQQIIGNLRDFARLDEAELKEVDVNRGIQSTLELLRGIARSQGVELIGDLSPLPHIACYPAKINQVIHNLVSNAIEASDRGATVIVASRASAGGGVELSISDSGRGIDPVIRSRIFDPFFTTKSIGKGPGLGLSISFGIVQAHGGTISVESEPGRGSRFTVHLPPDPPRPVHKNSLSSPSTSAAH